MNRKSLQGKHRLTEKQKSAKKNQWYKDQADLLDNGNPDGSGFFSYGGISDYKRMKVNYDLFNNIINIKDFEYVCQPFGTEGGELPANFTNRDIVSENIKVLLGMEMKMPFSHKVVAINEEATTRKEEEEFGRIRDFVVSEVMKPIRLETERRVKEETKGKELTPEEAQELQAQIEAEIEEKTPEKVRKYMTRVHQDPAEKLASQLLQYLLPKRRVKFKFNKGWKHSTLSGKEVYWVGILNGEPDIEVVNSLYFEHDHSDDLDFIEDGEWAKREMRMTPSEIISKFGSELDEDDIDDIYNYSSDAGEIADAQFTFREEGDQDLNIRVVHFNWKSLKMVQFLTYLDESGKEQMMLVDENYKLNPDNGDIRLEREWIPYAYECYKIGKDKYVHCRPVPGQYKDLDNLWECKLSYFGACVDSLNSPVTAPMDRMKTYQYLYNIIIYRVELLMASDKGKVLMANINAIPKSAGIDVSKFLYFLEANKIGFFNPNEEGKRLTDTSAGSLFKVEDMSLISDINKYMQLAEYIQNRCGNAIGVTPQMRAQIAAGEAVTNTRQNLIQSSYIMQPYFELHNSVKGNVLQAFLNTAIVAYSHNTPKYLSYVLDDMSVAMLKMDKNLLENSRYYLHMADAAKADDAKKAVEALSQAALQNQQADLSDIIKVIKADSIEEAEELLETAKLRNTQEMQAVEKMKIKDAQRARDAENEKMDKEHNYKMEEIRLQEGLRTDREIQKQTILSLGFNENKDEDGDGTPDVLEVAKFGVDADIKRGKLQQDQAKLDLEERKFRQSQKEHEYQKEVDEKGFELEEKKIQVSKQKKASSK